MNLNTSLFSKENITTPQNKHTHLLNSKVSQLSKYIYNVLDIKNTYNILKSKNTVIESIDFNNNNSNINLNLNQSVSSVQTIDEKRNINVVNMLNSVNNNGMIELSDNNFKNNILNDNKDKINTELKNKYNSMITLRNVSTFDVDLAKSQMVAYQFQFKQRKKVFLKTIQLILKNSFYQMKTIISTPIFIETGNTIIIQLFYFPFNKNNIKNNRKNRKNSSRLFGKNKNSQLNHTSFLHLHRNKLEQLTTILRKCFNKNVELHLIKVHSPYYNGDILAELFGLFSQHQLIKFRKLITKTFRLAKLTRNLNNNLSSLTSALTGFNIKLGGRITQLKAIPKYTVYSYNKGSLARNNSQFITTNRYTNKTRKGAFSFTINMGHKFKTLNTLPLTKLNLSIV